MEEVKNARQIFHEIKANQPVLSLGLEKKRHL